MTGPQAPPGKNQRPGRVTGAPTEDRGSKSLDVKLARFRTPVMARLGVAAVECVLSEVGYPGAVVQDEIARKIVLAEQVSAPKPARAEIKCGRPGCGNRYMPHRRDQVTCGSARCRQWWSRRQRTSNVTVARRPTSGTRDAGNREYSPTIPGVVEANCDSPRRVRGGGR